MRKVVRRLPLRLGVVQELDYNQGVKLATLKSIPKRINQYLSKRRIELNQFVFFCLIFFCVFILGNAVLPKIGAGFGVTVPSSWPISIIGDPVSAGSNLMSVILAVVVFWILVTYFRIQRRRLWLIIFSAFVLIVATNLFHGFTNGLEFPITEDYSTIGKGTLYWSDAQKVQNPIDFLKSFNHHQTQLSAHGQTHPPGAVLLYHGLSQVFVAPGLIALVVGIISVGMASFFFYQLLRTEVSVKNARLMTLIMMLLPAVQIYFISSMEAIIVGLVLGILYAMTLKKRAIFFTTVLLFILSTLSFSVMFIIPVMFAWDYLKKKDVSNVIISVLLVVNGLLIIEFFTGFSYWQSFITAAQIENPQGFMLLVDPALYVLTRIENVAEVILFWGPVMTFLYLKAWEKLHQRKRPSRLVRLSVVGVVVLVLMYLTGMYKTGETARINLFIYPFLLIPIAVAWPRLKLRSSEETWVMALVFLQTVIMQVANTYYW